MLLQQNTSAMNTVLPYTMNSLVRLLPCDIVFGVQPGVLLVSQQAFVHHARQIIRFLYQETALYHHHYIQTHLDYTIVVLGLLDA